MSLKVISISNEVMITSNSNSTQHVDPNSENMYSLNIRLKFIYQENRGES